MVLAEHVQITRLIAEVSEESGREWGQGYTLDSLVNGTKTGLTPLAIFIVGRL